MLDCGLLGNLRGKSVDAPKVTFDDGAAYERMIGTWSRIAGEHFIDWLKPSPKLRWIDVGCGNGAFTELLIDRCSASEVEGIDPSEAQISFARSRRPGSSIANYQRGDALSLPFPDNTFDAAAMALVIFFLHDPAKGVAEMVRVVKPGGLVATYAWDVAGGGLPNAPFNNVFREMGLPGAVLPSADASKLDVMADLWKQAGLCDVETTTIAVRRSFVDFDDYWETTLLAPTIGPVILKMMRDQVADVKQRVRSSLVTDSSGRVVSESRANAVKGRAV
jgi:SAM-dependent methyltransferase